MPFHDRYGLPITTRSDMAAAAYRRGIDLMLAAWPGAEDAFNEAVDTDPTFALAHAARARLDFGWARADAARKGIALSQSLIADAGTEREKSHVRALAYAIQGQPAKALDATLAHLDEWPRDALVLSQPLGAFGLFAFSGRTDHDQARVDLCERHAPHYGDDWWFLTYHGWSLTENGNVTRGRDLTQRALDMKRENANAAHALAHAMFEDGSIADAETLIETWLPLYDRAGILNGHIHWHRALLALEKDDSQRALEIYTAILQPSVTTGSPLNALTDAASLLWRIGLAGGDVPAELWESAAHYAASTFPNAGQSFADVHYALIAAARGRIADLDGRIAQLEQRAAAGILPAGSVTPSLCRGLRAFAEGKWRQCATLLEANAAGTVRIGGSHAQRELLEDTLLIAWMRSDQSDKARSLLDARLHRRPSLRDTRWRAAASA